MAALEQPDLILLDIMLPGEMDGYQVAERVRQFFQRAHHYAHSRDQQLDLLRGFDVGADDYMTKPFDAKELLARIRAVLKRTQRPRRRQVKPKLSAARYTLIWPAIAYKLPKSIS